MKKFYSLILSLCLLMVLVSCGSNKSEASAPMSSDISIAESIDEEIVADGYDVLGGQTWAVSGLVYNNQIVDINSSDALAQLNANTFLNFEADGTYSYSNHFITTGTYARYDGDGQYDYFLLKSKSVKEFDSDKGDYVETQLTESTTYIVVMLDEDTLEYAEFDALSGRIKDNDSGGDIPRIFSKAGESISIDQDSKSDSAQDSKSSTKDSFTNEYGSATTKCAHSGCNNYIASSGDTNCCTVHSNKCANCGKYIDEDAMYCMDCLSSSIKSQTSDKSNQKTTSNDAGGTGKCKYKEGGKYVCNNSATNGQLCQKHYKYLNDTYNSLVGN